MKQELVAGIDVAKDSLEVALYRRGQDQSLHGGRRFANNDSGWQALVVYLAHWSRRIQASTTAVYLEATGVYSERLCYALSAQVRVHVVPPGRMRHYLQAVRQLGKTDRLDAQGIGRFGAHHDWPRWQPPDPVLVELRQLTHRLAELQECQQQEHNRQHADQHRQHCQPEVMASRQRLLDWLDAESALVEAAIQRLQRRQPSLQRQLTLLQTIPGVGAKVAAVLAAEVAVHLPLPVEAVVAQLGLAPRPWESGTSVRARPRLAPARGRLVRRMLYMASLVGIRYNPVLKSFYQGLLDRGKPKKLALAACMRKLVHLVYGILKHQQPFQPNCIATKAA